MYKELFGLSARLSDVYEQHLESLEPQLIELLRHSNRETKNACLNELCLLNQKSMSNCMEILNRIKGK